MNPLVGNFVARLASVLLVATATIVWGIASLLVWISGNGAATDRKERLAR
jgi:hypothetical protein